MTPEQVAAAKAAIELLREALARQQATGRGVWLDAATPVWSAANFLWRSLPIADRD